MARSLFKGFDLRARPSVDGLAVNSCSFFQANVSLPGLAILAVLDDEDDEDEATVLQVAEAVEGIQKEGGGARLSKRDNENETYFIPLGFPYQLPKTYYKGSDPEWESFVQLSKNRERRERLKNELVAIVWKSVGDHPPLQRILGKQMVPRKFWIDIDYPDILPPEYEQRG
ncbi:MAG: hypothetical protein LQ342_007939 [Letrouitia transgressa]|nr:MAG: hypothetical protein LQ342_007939 [Letrouitia transgressa]